MEGHEPNRRRTDPATAENLKRLVRFLDSGAPLDLRLNGRRVTLPADANLSIDLDRDPRSGCVEVDIRWSLSETGKESSPPAGGGVPESARAGWWEDGVVNGRRASDSRGLKKGDDRTRAPHIRLKALVTAPSS